MSESSEASSILSAAQALMADLSAGAAERDAERILPVAEMNKVRAAGIPAARVPKAYGGPGLSFRDLAQIMLWLGAGDPNVAQSLQPHFVVLEMLREFGTEDQKRRYFGDILSGQIITNAFAERGTGVHGQMTTTLTSSNGGFRINGTKYYCTGSLFAEQLYVLVMTEQGNRTIAIVPADRDGLTIDDDWDAMGQRTTASGTVSLRNVFVSSEEVIAAETVWTERSHIGALAQLTHAAIDAGIAQAALDDAITHARTVARPLAESGVARASDDPYVISVVGEMRVAASTASAMVLRAGEAMDHTAKAQDENAQPDAIEKLLEEASIAVAEAKAASTRASLSVCEKMFTVSGASASVSARNFDRHWRNARTHTIHDPVSYKYKVIGDYMLNGRPPPLGTRF